MSYGYIWLTENDLEQAVCTLCSKLMLWKIFIIAKKNNKPIDFQYLKMWHKIQFNIVNESVDLKWKIIAKEKLVLFNILTFVFDMDRLKKCGIRYLSWCSIISVWGIIVFYMNFLVEWKVNVKVKIYYIKMRIPAINNCISISGSLIFF
jgi:hypothetical protein